MYTRVSMRRFKGTVRIPSNIIARNALRLESCRSFHSTPICPTVAPHAGHSSIPPLRSTSLGKPPRNEAFAKLQSEDLEYFRFVVGDKFVVTDKDALSSANTDWMHKFSGACECMLRPKNTEEISKILQYCNERRIAIVPQGGNTGLVGGSVPLYDEIVLSLGRMRNILDFDEVSGIVTVEAGVVLEELNKWLEERGFIVPLDLGAKGSCQIGGNVSTNAGGLRLVRYGSMHGNVLGLEVVCADGRVVDLLSTFRKDNTGYDLKQLFIGAEGTLGVVTKIALLTPQKPLATNVAFIGLSQFDAVLECVQRVRSKLSDILSAVEFLDRQSLDLVLQHIPGTRDPFSAPCPFYMLIETSGTNNDHDLEKLQAFLEEEAEKGNIVDGAVAQDMSQQKAFWVMREQIAEALGKHGTVYKYDISVPLKSFYSTVEDMRQRLESEPNVGVVGYGHLGDSNLHLNIHSPKYEKHIHSRIEPWLFERILEDRGSISAEHGLGQAKARYLSYSKSPEAIGLMNQIKDMFDPKGILNPYKVLPR